MPFSLNADSDVSLPKETMEKGILKNSQLILSWDMAEVIIVVRRKFFKEVEGAVITSQQKVIFKRMFILESCWIYQYSLKFVY